MCFIILVFFITRTTIGYTYAPSAAVWLLVFLSVIIRLWLSAWVNNASSWRSPLWCLRFFFFLSFSFPSFCGMVGYAWVSPRRVTCGWRGNLPSMCPETLDANTAARAKNSPLVINNKASPHMPSVPPLSSWFQSVRLIVWLNLNRGTRRKEL